VVGPYARAITAMAFTKVVLRLRKMRKQPFMSQARH
jgi:hypothetical protein